MPPLSAEVFLQKDTAAVGDFCVGHAVDASSVSWRSAELKEVCHTDRSKRIAASSEVVKAVATCSPQLTSDDAICLERVAVPCFRVFCSGKIAMQLSAARRADWRDGCISLMLI